LDRSRASRWRFLLGVFVEIAQVPARRISSSLLFAGLFFARGAGAETAPGVVEYTVAPGCPSAEAFSQQVAARTPVFREHAADHAVRVEIVSEPDGVLGRATLVLSGHAAERELRAARCEEVVEALALVVAILIDPNADTRPIAVAAAPPADAAPVPAPAAEGPPVEPPAAPRPAPRPAPSSRPAPVPPAGPSSRFIAGAHATAEGAVAPELTLGPRLFLGLDLHRDFPWPSSLRLSAGRSFSRTMRDEQGRANLVLDTGRADGCFLRVTEKRLSLEPCASVSLGVVRVDGEHPLGGTDHTLFWADVGGLVRASVGFLDRFVGEAEIGVDVPLVQYRYSFQGREPVFQSARVGMHLGLGLGVRFP
jgi:hypothetical protein